MAYSSKRNKEGRGTDLRDISAGASCVHMVAGGGHRGSYKRPLYHTISVGPKPSWCNDKISRDRNQYYTQTQGRGGVPPLQKSFSGMEDKDPYDLVLRKYDSHTRAISCIRDRRYANRARLWHPPRPFSFPSLLSPPKTRAGSKSCCTGVYRSYAMQCTAGHKEFLCISRSGRYGILRLAWWRRIYRDGLS